jgi:hemolysin III
LTYSPTSAAAARPQLRGAFHGLGLLVALGVGIPFVLAAPDGKPTAAAATFAGAVVGMLAASTLYHRVAWTTQAARLRMRRVDHAGIYILIAGTYTPVGLLVLEGTMQTVVLAAVWIGAGVATLVKCFWVGAPKWLSAVFGLLLGWSGVAAMPELWRESGASCVLLLAAGGIAYSAGAVVYALRRPNLSPTVFGYHELFHVLTLVALACQYVAIAFFVVKVA